MNIFNNKKLIISLALCLSITFAVLLFGGFYYLNQLANKIEFSKTNYEWTLTKTDGSKVELSSFKNKVIFLNLWATWCKPCIKEMPSINNLFIKMKSQNCEFVIVSIDDDFDKFHSFVKDNNYSFPIYNSNNLPKEFSIIDIPGFRIPLTFIIDKEGNIVEKYFGQNKWDDNSFVDKLNTLLIK